MIHRNNIYRYLYGGCTVALLLLLSIINMRVFHISPESFFIPEATPWQSIGGCGVGGSGAGGGADNSITWIGNSVTGHILTIEALPKFVHGTANGLTYGGFLAAPRISLHPTWQTALDITLPHQFQIAQIQPQTNVDETVRMRSGTGDICAAVRHSFGSENAFTVTTSLTFPTGRYDAQYGPEQSRKILPRILQTGRGIYSLAAGFTYTETLENGILQAGATFNFPFNMRFDRQNEYLDSYYKSYRGETANIERFHYRHIIKPYGESDRGDYYPPSVQLTAARGWKRGYPFVQSLQCSFSSSLGTAWICDPQPTLYAPIPNPGHTAWNALVFYGIEYCGLSTPLFAGIGMPVFDKQGANNRWDGIDTDALFQCWIVAFGITAGLF